MVAAAARELTSQTGERTSLGGHGGRLWHYVKATSSDTLSKSPPVTLYQSPTSSDTLSTARSCYLIFSTRDKESKFSLKAHAWHKVSTHSVNFLHTVWTFLCTSPHCCDVLPKCLEPSHQESSLSNKAKHLFFPSVCLLGILLIAMARITNVSTPIQKD